MSWTQIYKNFKDFSAVQEIIKFRFYITNLDYIFLDGKNVSLKMD